MNRCLKNLVQVTSLHNGIFRKSGYGDRLNPVLSSLFWSCNQRRSKSTAKKILGQTQLLFEEGSDIQELPVIVKEASDLDIIALSKSSAPISKSQSCTIKKHLTEDIETREMIQGFDRCYTAKGVFTLLEMIPPDEVTPSVALQALKTITRLENNQEFRNQFQEYRYELDDLDKPRNSTRMLVCKRLVDLILTKGSSDELLEVLKVISRDVSVGNNDYKKRVCDEILIRISDGKFNIIQICESVRALTLCGYEGSIDKVWVGIMENQNDINETNIIQVFRILIIMRLSRNLILKILQKRFESFWFKISGADAAEILSILNKIHKPPNRIIACLSRWINTNLHTLNEDDLSDIVKGFTELQNSQQGVEKALERYIKAKKLKIENPDVMIAVMNYCKKFRIRSPVIFEGCIEYFIQNSKNLTPSHLKSIFYPFGYLNVSIPVPRFWEVLECELNDRFVQLCPEDALDILLAFVYLEKYPVNFIKKIFNPYFLDRLHSLKDSHLVQLMRTKLKLLDTAMTLECDSYNGPLLPPDLSTNVVTQDGRIERISHCVKKVLTLVYGSPECVSSSVVLKNLPLTELYIIDLIAHPNGMPSFSDYRNMDNICTAFLIHLPEHYDSRGEHLIGSQTMRKRHLKCLGLKVVDLDYCTLLKLKYQEKQLEEYLKEQMFKSDMNV